MRHNIDSLIADMSSDKMSIQPDNDTGDDAYARPPPMVHVSQVRETVGGGLRQLDSIHQNYDIEQNIREIRAILSTNNEIFDRCIKSRKKDSLDVFIRYFYHVVDSYSVSGSTHFVTYPERSEK